MSKKLRITNEAGCYDHPNYHGIRAPQWGTSTQECKKCQKLYRSNPDYTKEDRKRLAIHADRTAEYRRNGLGW